MENSQIIRIQHLFYQLPKEIMEYPSLWLLGFIIFVKNYDIKILVDKPIDMKKLEKILVSALIE